MPYPVKSSATQPTPQSPVFEGQLYLRTCKNTVHKETICIINLKVVSVSPILIWQRWPIAAKLSPTLNKSHFLYISTEKSV